jgi:hypothetical protein
MGGGRSACHVARPCPSFVTIPWVVSGGERQTARPATQTKPERCDGNAAGCYSDLLHAHAARRLLLQGPHASRETGQADRRPHVHDRLGRAGQPMGLIKSNTARRSWRLTPFDWLVSMPIGPGDWAPSHPIRRANVRRPCFESFDSYSSDIHLLPPTPPDPASQARAQTAPSQVSGPGPNDRPTSCSINRTRWLAPAS